MSGTGTDTVVESQAQTVLGAAIYELGGTRREGQEKMLGLVENALATRRHLLIQAGTGTGKSLAYLVPAVLHSVDAERPVVISTATLALQAQIMGRDLPRLLETVEPHLPREIDVALVKGRANYLCQHKLSGGYPDQDADDEALFAMEIEPQPGATAFQPSSALGKEISALREWAKTTETGDRDDLPISVSDRAWSQVSVNAVDCLGARSCPAAQECFTELARQQAAEADIVITNHAMLAIDAFEELGVLPDYEAVIIDEAHELTDRVTSAVTAHLSANMISTAASAAHRHTAINVDELRRCAKAMELAFAEIPEGLLLSGLSEDQGMALEATVTAVKTALRESKPSSESESDAGRTMARSRLQTIHDVAERMLSSADTTDVIWAHRESEFTPHQGYREPELSDPAMLYVAPTSVASRLRRKLFDDRTVIMTSATLALGGRFDMVAAQMGLPPAAEASTSAKPGYDSADVGTPFDYRSQGMVYVAKHLPTPKISTESEQQQELLKLITASNGATLALFSSRRAAESAAKAIRAQVDLPILCQGESSMASLIRQFADDEETSLFGTMSLWQGVDVPGRSCRLVVIDKIPFPRPDDPLNMARSREAAQAGRNGFLEVSASRAAVRLAQGAGRLIRSADDRGVLAILDSRIATARYGSFLRASMPDFWATTQHDVAAQALRRLAKM